MPNVSRGTNAGDKQHYRNKEFLQCLISRLEQLRKESELENINKTSRWKICKDIKDLNISNNTDLIDIYKALYPATAKYAFFSNYYGTFNKID